VTGFVNSRGYLQAKFGEPKRTVTGNGLVLTIHVKEGLLYRFGDMRIEGAEALSANEIRSRIDLQRGDVANGEKLSKALFEDIKKLYWEMGFIQYTAELNPTFADDPEHENEGIVDLEVTIDEGKRFKLRSLKFEANLLDEELRNLFLIREGDIFNQRLFEDSITKLNDTGLFWFIDKDKDSDFKVDDEAATISVVIKLQRRGY
jgi:outer membrane protein assembly factor BamA